MIVTGGLPETEMPNDTTINVEELNLAELNAHWIESPFELPFQELYGHVCVVTARSRMQYIKFSRLPPIHRRCLAI